MRSQLIAGKLSPAAFRTALTRVPVVERDAWLDALFGLDGLPEDGPDRPHGCVPYLPCSVATLLCALELARVSADDVFVDLGSGVGRATALAHFVTGASAIGIEIQVGLVNAARKLTWSLNASRVAVVHGDAAQLTGFITIGTVFFLYCPFSGARLERVLDSLEDIARTRPIRICCVDLVLPTRSWLSPMASATAELAVYHSVGLHEYGPARD
ncbi:hypothetical protein Hoch_1397 [Haliangium ochraceum DSM 14365]|uniref:DOT1 domain-containing protein n=2 Tax=Haliangium ochraceum TaxID=80816 RepID=D0LUR1_HALO1|nr:hypothetical protein Hoch_1397 [Haliangium ochraceum DSM 14365]